MERAFEVALTLNELHYALQEGYRVLKYNSIRYYATNDHSLLHDFMTLLSSEKELAKGVPESVKIIFTRYPSRGNFLLKAV